jgi:hypothetical protein
MVAEVDPIDQRGGPVNRRRTAVVGGIAAGVLAWMVIGGVPGAVAAVPSGVIVGVLLNRIESPSKKRERKRAVGDLPLACDLLAAALRAGAPIERSVGIVAIAIGGPLGVELRRVRDGLRLGLDPREAWAAVRLAEAGRLVDAAVRGVDREPSRSADRVASRTLFPARLRFRRHCAGDRRRARRRPAVKGDPCRHSGSG